uniref:PI-PLC X domain-containing protein 1 n=1 Tax=Bos indicus x Bos taurus TaxID=30522 RepID=A0A4W2I8D6_BOBOX
MCPSVSASLTDHRVFKVHPQCSLCQNFTPFHGDSYTTVAAWGHRGQAQGVMCPPPGLPAGSHSMMTYCLNKKSPISHKESRLLQTLGKVLPCVTLPVVLKRSTTQVRVCGHARALDPDLQMAHMEEGTERNLHSGHMVYMTALTEDMLTEISEWLENHPQEVVILACRNFKGVMEDLHEYLMGCIKNIFGDMLCPMGCEQGPQMLTLHQLWSQGQQVILSYKDEASVSQHAELWPGIPYWWGNQVKPRDLVHHLELMKSCSHPGELMVAGINLSENLEFVRVHPAWSLEKLTQWGLPYLCAWVRGQCPGSATRRTNTVAGEFIWADGFVGDVIGLNWKLLGAEGRRM